MIFVDTWAWIALALKRDQNHRRVKALNKSFRRARRRYVTTDFVLSELIAHLYRTLTPAQAQGFINSLFAALEASDELMRRVLRGIHYVPILTPLGIDTLDFGLSRDKRKLLFDTGYLSIPKMPLWQAGSYTGAFIGGKLPAPSFRRSVPTAS
jgi:predicted nucleic acid-binding protein